MILESGPSGGDRNYYLIFFLVCLGMAGWFYRDGAWGYISANREEAHRHLAPLIGVENVPAELGDSPTESEFERVQEGATDAQPFRQAFGDPIDTKSEGAGRRTEYYVSDFGLVTVQLRGKRIDPARPPTWTGWKHNTESLRTQFACAIIALAVGLYIGYRLVKAMTLKCVIDEHGMTYGSHRIVFDDMTALRDYSRRGWVDLYHKRSGEERKLRIDNQKIRKFDEIIDVLCERLGFADPRDVAPDRAAAQAAADSDGDDNAGAGTSNGDSGA